MSGDQPGVSSSASTPPAVQGDLDALLTLAVSTARDALGRRQGFQPFAVLLGADRHPQVSWVDPEVSGPNPRAAELLPLLVASLRERRAGLLAGGVVADTSAPTGGAIRVELEHRDGGRALVVVVPYRASWVEGQVSLGEAKVVLGTRRVWDETV